MKRFSILGISGMLLVGFLVSFANCSMVDDRMENNGDDADDTTGDLSYEVAYPNLSFTRPVDFQSPEDGSGRVFVVEQAGRIYVFPNEHDVESKHLFLDIRDRVDDRSNEEGLLGLAFHPNYEENGRFFVDYTAGDPARTVIAEYQVDPSDPSKALKSSEKVLLEVSQPYGNHNAGQIGFGPDDYFYITFGDGGAGGDPHDHGQDPSTLLATILRVDVEASTGDKPYGIPADNPFAGQADEGRPEVWAYGLRNPWRFSFDPETGHMWVGDVGQNAWEEIDVITEGGMNFGWNRMEGNHCYEPQSDCQQPDLVDPIHEYGRDVGQSITGGFVYRLDRVPALKGRYVYADYETGRIWALSFTGTEKTGNELLFNTDLGISSFGTDADGHLYFCAFDGNIYHFTQE